VSIIQQVKVVGGRPWSAYIRLAAKWRPCNESCGGWFAERLSQQAAPSQVVVIEMTAIRHQALLVGWCRRFSGQKFQDLEMRMLVFEAFCEVWNFGEVLFGSIAFLEGESS